MFDALVLHDTTRAQLERFAASPAHALLLTGPDGIGKTALAEALLTQLLNLEAGKLAAHPHYLMIRPQGTSISIDDIRRLQKFLQLKTAGEHALRRAVIIEHAHTLTTEAQNAYLKLLEEPPADTVMILTANSSRALLPTILSRAQSIAVTAPLEAQLKPMLSAGTQDEATQRQAYFLSGGLPGLLKALLDEDQTHPLLASVTQAKALLQQSTFERLARVDALSKQKEAALGVVDALERIAVAGLQGSAARNEQAKVRQWHRVRKQAVAAKEALLASANTKLVLSNLFLNIS